MSFLKKVWSGNCSLAFTFWVMGCVFPAPIFIGKVYLRDAGVLSSDHTPTYLVGQAFLWLEWLYFLFITVALWNASVKHLQRARAGGPENLIWGQLGRALAVASGILAAGSFANLSGLTALLFGEAMYIGLGGG